MQQGGYQIVMEEEVFKERVPWLDSELFLVGIQRGNKVDLRLVYRTGGLPSYDRKVHDVCEFAGGEVIWHPPDYPGVMNDAERLCLSVMPKDFNPIKMPEVLRDPYWQWILDHMRAAYIMSS